jgi:hypothetical protein
MIIEQTIEIPADHRLILDVPPEIPAGRAILTFTPAPMVPEVKPDDPQKQATPISDRLLGIAAHMGDISRDELRAERLGKYLK